MKETAVKTIQSTQRLLPIREVSGGLVITTDNRYIRILEVLPVNFLMKSAAEQNAIAQAYRDMFKAGPANLQIKVISRTANMKKHLEILKEEMLSEKSENCYQMQKEYARLLKDASRDGSVQRRFFIMFEYEHEGNLLHKATRKEIAAQMETVASRITACLAECGNEVIDFDDRDGQALEILFTLLNAKKSGETGFEKIEELVMRKYANRLSLDSEGMMRTLPYIPATDYIAPAKITFPRDPGYMVIDRRYYTYAYIPSEGYNMHVVAGWISPFINACEGIDVDLYFNRIPREQVLFRIRQSINQNRATLRGSNDTQANFEQITESVAAGRYLKEGLARGEDFYYMAMILTISGDTKEEAEWKFNELKKNLSTMDITIRKCSHEIEQAFISTLPLCRMDQGLWKKAKRNILTEGAASTYPFTSFEMVEEDGILLGRNLSNNSLAMLNIFNTKIYANSNVFITGNSGAGKTYALLLLAQRMRLKHIPVIIIAPEKEHEFERVARAIGGQFIRFGSGSPHNINIMDIRKTDDAARRLLDGGGIISSRLNEKIQDLKTFFKLLIPDITIEERELIDEALVETYRLKGITGDNDSLLADPSRPDGEYKEMPILGDLHATLNRMKDDGKNTGRIATIINMLVSGSGSSFNAHTNVDLDNEFVVLGLEHISNDLLPMGMFMAIDYAWSKIKEDRTKRKTLLIDEWWRFSFEPVCAAYSNEIAKTIRAYGGSLVLATQQMGDIFATENGKFGEGVLNNCKIKIIMQLEEHDADGVHKLLHLTDMEKNRITRFRQGEALLLANGNSVAIKFEANATEHRLITTDRAELERQLAEMRQSQFEASAEEIDDILEFGDADGPDIELYEEYIEADFPDGTDTPVIIEPETQVNETSPMEGIELMDGPSEPDIVFGDADTMEGLELVEEEPPAGNLRKRKGGGRHA